MIPLRLPIRAPGRSDPFVVRLNADAGLRETPFDIYLEEAGDELVFDGPGGRVSVSGVSPDEADGDVLLVLPGRNLGHRLIRASSAHNTLLVTERCDQLCVMCSQPPKAKHVDMFAHLETAALLAPSNATIGISGGEPTLFKDQLLVMLERVTAARPDLSFHVLSNAQHFTADDIDALRTVRSAVTWGVPIYSTDPATHDGIVGKIGAFGALLDGLALLCRAGAAVELRTVVMRRNLFDLPRLARFVTTHIPFAVRWAIMHLENIGYARRDWPDLFADTSVAFADVAEALDLARARGIQAVLYNFPLCTVPEPYRYLAPSSISDWKRKYLKECSACTARDRCGGFFEWYPEGRGFSGVHPL
ncbi:His-Xaa-Ser system radical SAM maturase HxsC [Oharaeibacter diazotrophicus]|uniref:His-Xaa-Ser system radical SAM maturase HxsC n=1 Tax=Oharaeibacter diazotrophicus TaxID=1920512 RepID=A0A4V6PVF4_9HYPH|nr:His-Xaa-Ser system radical SAM maturase HxsC [Oharaeibacter diazotrophicus]TDP83938.1 His-Xaa-Ser system radical SAM maturase HxsC [Oharaeibacter diazotrophicus]BBE72979.1 radical SAM superfamily protein [Pleomorphomonas sp. SM30]GLS74768.1 His-Xaa-Ser system radical SAM maturase HxsC [Oharaeibacter diazotrophicus]